MQNFSEILIMIYSQLIILFNFYLIIFNSIQITYTVIFSSQPWINIFLIWKMNSETFVQRTCMINRIWLLSYDMNIISQK